jgi:hemerythrin-like domain-containing protein
MSNENSRREFLKSTVVIGALSGIVGLDFVQGCNKDLEEEVSPAEDLMREHGALNRILLIYDACKFNLINGQKFPLRVLKDSATIIRNFIENYHEKLEEDFLFPRFEKANQQTELVKVLRQQHNAGRSITDRIINGTKSESINNNENKNLIKLLENFNFMYRPHEAREDTVLFPALKKIVSSHEYDSLGEDFEKKEHELFGQDGFETMVDKVATLEKQLGIYDLSKFTII